MKHALLLLPALALFYSPAAALAPSTTAYLQQIGISDSSDVKQVSDDVINGTSLDSLARKQDADGIRRFIATRAFFHRFKRDSSISFPPDGLYDVAFLSDGDQAYITRKIQEEFGVKSA